MDIKILLFPITFLIWSKSHLRINSSVATQAPRNNHGSRRLHWWKAEKLALAKTFHLYARHTAKRERSGPLRETYPWDSGTRSLLNTTVNTMVWRGKLRKMHSPSKSGMEWQQSFTYKGQCKSRKIDKVKASRAYWKLKVKREH